MSALAASANPASVIAAISASLGTLIMAIMAWRAQSYKQLLKDFAELFRKHEENRRVEDHHTVKAIKKAIQEALGGEGNRRWYDKDPGDEG